MPGWGFGGFGIAPWGGGFIVPFDLIKADPVGENVVRLTFTEPPYSDGVGGIGDALDIPHYTVAAVAGGVGLDGKAVRGVGAIAVALVADSPAQLDVFVDRPFSPYPCQYRISISGLIGAISGFNINIGTLTFDGMLRTVENQSAELSVKNRDIAMPQSPGATLDPLPDPLSAILGSYNVDVTGDYAFDEGLTGYKKRILRKIYCRKGRFVFLPSGWGVGIVDELKKLCTPGHREAIRAEIQSQILEEPDTDQCSVQSLISPASPSIVRYHIKATMRDGRVFETKLPFYIGP